MKFLKLTLLVIIALSATSLTAQKQKLPIGVVNIQQVVQELPEAQKIDKQIQEITKMYQDSLISMQKNLQSKFESYKKQRGMMTEEKQLETEQQLQAQNQEIQQFQMEKFGQQGEVQQRRAEMLEPLRTKIKNAIDKVAESEELELILDKSTEVVMFSHDKYDITYKVLDTLKRGDE